jgi:hypothetical protein
MTLLHNIESIPFNMAEAETVSKTLPPMFDLVTFSIFPKLPVELQLSIWKLTIPGPRVVSAFSSGHQINGVLL